MFRAVVACRRIGALIAVASFLVVAAPAAANPPAGGTQLANTTETTATLSAHLYSDDGSVTYYFEYGTTTAYGTRTADVTASPGGGTQYQEVVGGLSPSTTYHYRVRARNSSGELVGDDSAFTTKTPPPDADGDGYPDAQDNCPNAAGGPGGTYNAPGCPVPPDSDGDGFPDPQDSCPTKPGPAQSANNSQGCPVAPNFDTDGDGVQNQYDACPNTAGSRDASGCPDRDGDFVPDATDECPNLKGPVNEDEGPGGNGSGCPDKDLDGVRDSEDACPTQEGDADAKGCPPVKAFFNFPSRDTWEMGHRKGQVAVCRDTPRMADCSWRIHVALTAASADKLGLKNRELVDRLVKPTGRSAFFQMITGKWAWRPSDALTAALKRYGRPITIILSGSYKVEGSGVWKKMDSEKRRVKPKPCGWTPFTCDG